MEPSFLGISKAEWELYNSFANWLSAIGTLLAVTVSLLLARRASKATASASVRLNIIIETGNAGPYPEYVVFRLVNTGMQPIRVTQIGWSMGLFKKRYAVQMYDQLLSSKLPADLEHGQEAHWFVPLAFDERGWAKTFAERMLLQSQRMYLATLKAHFSTSIGDDFTAKPDKAVRETLAAACADLAKSKAN
jgi:hypothetical protein